jgi:hypothetical protein
MVKAFVGKVGAFTDAHTGMAQQQKHVGRQIIAAQEFLLE